MDRNLSRKTLLKTKVLICVGLDIADNKGISASSCVGMGIAVQKQVSVP